MDKTNSKASRAGTSTQNIQVMKKADTQVTNKKATFQSTNTAKKMTQPRGGR